MDSQSRGVFNVVNPSNEQIIASVAVADAADIDIAVNAAKEAFNSATWSQTTTQNRAALLQNLLALVEAHKSELAQLGNIHHPVCTNREYHRISNESP